MALLERLRMLVGSAQDASFDDITRLAARALDAPLSLVSFVTNDEQFFAGMDGALPPPWHEARATPLSHSLCQHVANTGKPLVVPDAREHPLVRDNPAIRDLNVIAYLGVPLQTASGFVLGSFCIIDGKPRQWMERDLETLRGLSALIMVDIEARLARAQLTQQIKSLRTSEERRTDHTSLLVHDLRTPLNSLLLGLQTIPLLGDLNEDQQEAFRAATRGGRTLVELVDDLLDTAAADEQGAASLRVIAGLDPAELLADAVAQVMGLATHRGLTLLVEAASDTLPVQPIDADAGKVVRALVNLISNAIKFTPKGGRVALSMHVEDRDGRCHVVFAVRDTGKGISPEDQARLFGRFASMSGTADSPTQRSSGIGLFFVKSVAEAHGGQVTVESESGQGSTFSLVLPCRQPLGRRTVPDFGRRALPMFQPARVPP